MKLGGVYIKAIGCAEASGRADNQAQAAALGKNLEFIDQRIGTRSLPEATEEETAVALGLRAADEALDIAGLTAADIGMVIFVTQNPEHGGLPHNAALIQHQLGLPVATICFDMGLGCSGYCYALVTAASLMKAAACRYSLVVTSDQYRANLAPDDMNTRLLFGDGACATVLGLDDGSLEICAARLGTDGSGHSALIRKDGWITMNGRAVFNFSRKIIASEIESFLDDIEVSKSSLDAVLLHQGSKAIVEEIRTQLKVSENCCPVEMEGRGNTVSSSLPFMLAPRLEQDGPRRIIAAGFGVGLSWGLLWLERRKSV